MHVGSDALYSNFNLSDFSERLAGRNRHVKLVLMDQAQMAGMGNTYSNEILFNARIHPAAPAGMLDADRSRHLFHSMHIVLRAAIDLHPPTDSLRTRLPADFFCPIATPAVIVRDAEPNSKELSWVATVAPIAPVARRKIPPPVDSSTHAPVLPFWRDRTG
jgi:hypothetical protein